MSRSKESPIEGMIKGIVQVGWALLSLALLTFFVVMSPNAEKLGSANVSPGSIDKKILENTSTIKSKIEATPQGKAKYVSKMDSFQGLMANSLGDLKLDIIAAPTYDINAVQGDREYDIPSLPKMVEMFASAVRTVGFMPTVELAPGVEYSTAEVEPMDIDVVTVQAKFDISELFANFEKSFSGRSLKSEWRDENLANVVFAGVQMQRQELTASGWSDWKVVERPKVDKYAKLMQQVYNVDSIAQLNVLMTQFVTENVWDNALQHVM